MDGGSSLFGGTHVVASVKDDAGLRAVLASKCPTAFLLYGDLLSIGPLSRRLAEAGRRVFINIDMVDGLAARPASVEFIRDKTSAVGVLSSKAAMVRAAHTHGMKGVLRFFMIDSFAYSQVAEQVRTSRADAVEVLPGCIPRVISWMRADVQVPIVAGGLVCNARDVESALESGADAVATSSSELWVLGASGA